MQRATSIASVAEGPGGETRRERLVAHLVLVYCLLTPCALLPPLGGVRVAVVDVLLLVSAPLVLTVGWSYAPGPGRWLAALAGFVLLSLTQVSDNHVVSECSMKAVRFCAITTPFFLGVAAPPRPGLMRKAVWCFFGGGAISMLLALAIYFFRIDLGREVQTFQFGDELRTRAVGIFGDTGQFGHLLSTWTIVSLVLLPLVGESRLARLASLIALVLGMTCLYLSLSRGSMANLLGALLAALFMPGGKEAARVVRRHVKQPFAAFGLTLLVGVIFIAGTGLLDSIVSTLKLRIVEGTLEAMADNPDAALAGRLTNNEKLLPHFIEQPFLGTGYKALAVSAETFTDNQFLGTLFDTGLLGFAAMLGFLGTLAYRLFRLELRGDGLAWAMLVVWAGQLVQAFTTDTFTFWGGMPGLLAITGLVVGRRSQSVTVQQEHRCESSRS